MPPCDMLNDFRNGLQDQTKPKKTYGHSPHLIGQCKDSTPIVVPFCETKKPHLPEIFICVKSQKPAEDKPKKTKKRSKSRELLGGVLLIGCDCERRNGLQDQCPRTQCQGSPECMLVPPTCGPSEFGLNKHMVKQYENNQRERKEFIKKWKEKEAAAKLASAKKDDHREKVYYECIPVEQIIRDGLPCPICTKPKHSKPKPVIIQFPVDCLCCPEDC